MVFPMSVLGVFVLLIGYVNTPWFGEFLGDWLKKTPYTLDIHHSGGSWWMTIMAIVISLAGIYLAWMIYGNKEEAADSRLVRKFGGLRGVLVKPSIHRNWLA